MMFYFALAMLFLGAAGCFALDRRLATRWLGIVAAALAAGAGALVAAEPWPGPAASPLTLLELGDLAFVIAPALPPVERMLAAALLLGGAGAFLMLAAALALAVRDFGAIFAWGLLALAAALLSLAAPPTSLMLPAAWAAGALASYGAIQASGALRQGEGLPQGLILGLLGSLLLLGGQVAGAPALAAGEQPPGLAALAFFLGALALGGLAPLHGARAEAIAAPTPLGALVYGLVLPTLALGALLRVVAALPVIPPAWAVTLALPGALGALAAAAGALGERRLRPLLAWLSGAQASAILVTAGMSDPQASIAGPTLLLSLMLSTLVGAAAVAALERSSGSDDYTGDEPGPRLPLAGLLWAGAGAAAIGLPPFLSFWGRSWLIESTLALMPWLVPPLLAAGVLTTLAALVPLGRFWAPPRPDRATVQPSRSATFIGALALTVLLVSGLAPQLAWTLALSAAPFAPAQLPLANIQPIGVAALTFLLLILGWFVARRPSARSLTPNPDETPVRLSPAGLADGLRPLAWLGWPGDLLRALWDGLGRSSELLRVALSIFEQRYYLLGVLMVLIVIMLLMAQ